MKSDEFFKKLNELMMEYSRQNGVVITSINPNPEIIVIERSRKMLTKYETIFEIKLVDVIK